MPAGNDAAAAAADLVSKGGVSTNVERLIDAQRASVGSDVIAASLRTIDPEATAQLDLSKVKVPDGHKVLSGAVRGKAAVFVVEGPDGRTYKMVDEKQSASDYEAPAESAQAAYERELTQARVNEAAEIQRIRAESERRLEEARAEIARAEAEELAKIRKDSQKQLDTAAKEAEEADEKDGDSGSSSGGGSGNAGEVTPPGDAKQAAGPKRATGKQKDK